MGKLRSVTATGALVAFIVVVAGTWGTGAQRSNASATSSSTGVRAGVFSRAAATTGAARSFRMAVTITAARVGFGLHGAGVFDISAQAGEMTIGIPATGLTGPSTARMIFLGQTAYINFPLSASAVLGASASKPWLKFDTSRFGNGRPPPFNFGAPGFTDPLAFLNQLRTAAQNVTLVGPDFVMGVRVTHYRGTLDLTKAENGRTVASRLQLQSGVALSRVPVDAWVDHQGRLRKIVESLSTQQSTVGTIAMTLEFYDFGVAVHVVAPLPGQVVDATEAMLRASRGLGGAGAAAGSSGF